MSKNVKQPGSNTATEDGLVPQARQIRIDTSRNEIRLGDGVTPGGYRIPNIQTVEQMISDGINGQLGQVVVLESRAEIVIETPAPNKLVLVKENRFESWYFWKPGPAAVVGDMGGIDSAISGHWHLVDSQVNLLVEFYRAGIIDLALQPVPPAINPVLVWIDSASGLVYLNVDGATWQQALPSRWAAFWAQVGNYVTVPKLKSVSVYKTAATTVTGNIGLYTGYLDQENAPSFDLVTGHFTADGAGLYMAIFQARNQAAAVLGQVSIWRDPAAVGPATVRVSPAAATSNISAMLSTSCVQRMSAGDRFIARLDAGQIAADPGSEWTTLFTIAQLR